MKTLFQTYRLNDKLILKNKIVMAPMTRNMANNDLSPTQAMVDYYGRRADAGLIVTEGTFISPCARGFSHVPGIFTQAHIDAWHRVTDKVHQQDGRIFLQIWHVGRVSHPQFLDGQLPIGPSESVMTGRIWRTKDLSYGKSRAATLGEIQALVESYTVAAKNAITAGFDGVEIHGANGYLIDQFLHYHTNFRTDGYGGAPEKMARFALEVVTACGELIGFDKVGLRLSPAAYLNEIVGDRRDSLAFQYLLNQLNSLSLAYVHTGNFNDKQLFAELNNKTMTGFLREYYQGTLIASGGYTIAEADAAIEQKQFDLIALGRSFLANPDLIQRLRENIEIRAYDESILENLY